MQRKVPTIEPTAPPGETPTERDLLRTALRVAGSALKASGLPFALAGGYALWVHGAPETEHDVDYVVAEEDVEAAAAVLAEAGMAIERPPEDWLFKAWLDGALVDVLHRLNGAPVDSPVLELAQDREVLGIRIPVLPADHIVGTKLRTLTERYCDFGALLPVVRAVREQLDWQRLRRTTADSPFAESFLLLTDRLGISPPAG
ncbi:hypothetical protein [Nakamurella endophytica]|uniref:Nucleotidyltransferase family protein n=1 Tax=Nakamurella endophytica TaxID=1748367 RepID=A0A917TCF6_9ACTN|nr:hypothetical protein [Nakamurella endophytica]GGM18516.1 hypothetical protein GCM10011594_43230 [Nakamurella endophytica]